MEVSEILNKLIQIGDYYSKLDGHENNKKYSFYTAANNLHKAFKSSKITDVTKDYNFMSIPGIGEGIYWRILCILRGEHLVELEPSYNTTYYNISEPIKEVLRNSGINSNAELELAMKNPELHHVIPDSVIMSYGRIRKKYIENIVNNILLYSEEQIKIVGSYRRNLPTVHDLDFLVVVNSTAEANVKINKLIENLKCKLLFSQLNKGDIMRKYQISSEGITIKADFKVIPSESLGTALLHFTGPVELNISTRSQVKKLGYTLNEYGLFDKEEQNITYNFTEENIIKILKSMGVDIPNEPYLRGK